MFVRLLLPITVLLILVSFVSQKPRLAPVSAAAATTYAAENGPGMTAPSCELRYDSTIKRAYYIYVDEPASYRGGMDSLAKTIQKNIRYPQIDRCQESGTVWISFIIEPDGTISNKKIVKPAAIPGFNAEALRVIDSVKDWIPGKCQGEAVPVLYYFPVRFVMQ